MSLTIVSGAAAAALVGYDDAIVAMRDVFQAFDRGDALTFPATRGQGSHPGTRFGLKPGFDGVRRLPGVKIGSYWPGNESRGLPNHGSTTVLLDDETGYPAAIVEATWLNALRTAGSDAVAVDLLARADASALAIIGTGNQAYHDARAIALVRRLDRVMIVGRDLARAGALALRLRQDGLPARVSSMGEALGQADIVVTVTTSRGALFAPDAIRPGTHISAMGADGPGKQELPPELARRAALFADAPEQSTIMGEFQYLAGTADAERITGLGAVLNGRAPGRTGRDQITIYDSSGIGLQDIAIAALAVERARAAGQTQEVMF